MAALAREPGLTRAELYARMLPDNSATSAVAAVRAYCAGGRWPSAEQLDVLAAGLGIPVARLLAEPDER